MVVMVAIFSALVSSAAFDDSGDRQNDGLLETEKKRDSKVEKGWHV